MRPLHWVVAPFLLAVLAFGLAACGPAKKSVFPPTVSIQQLQVLSNGQWQLSVRIQNNSYAGMDFQSLDGQLQVAALAPVRLHDTFELAIPQLAGDVVQLKVWPTAAMSRALEAIADKGSAASLAYSISGTATAKPEQESKARAFDFSGKDWISAVPGIAHTFR